ncbi:hypothetical protein NT04LS_0041 [Listeria seeligeri FSL S4-171]|nr:hypothetical protein NT04LS_0041 [Listeria seeligeri FSL S4-171]
MTEKFVNIYLLKTLELSKITKSMLKLTINFGQKEVSL